MEEIFLVFCILFTVTCFFLICGEWIIERYIQKKLAKAIETIELFYGVGVLFFNFMARQNDDEQMDKFSKLMHENYPDVEKEKNSNKDSTKPPSSLSKEDY
jgi:hypothetical protein